MIVGAYLADDGGTDSGSAYIFFGSNSPANTIDASAANVLLIGGNAGDRFSVRANYAGDFNKDGIDDVIIGADYDNEGGSKAGAAFIFFGSSSPSGTINASAADVKLVGGDADDRFGYAVSYAGDYNGDGYDDVLVGANMDDDAGSSSGSCFLFFGSATPPNKIDAAVANVKFIGEIANDRFGVGLSGAGDFNKDGYDDVIISSSYKDLKGTDSGCVYIFFGSASPSGTVNASTADVKLIGASAGDMFGHNVANAGDFDNDGYNDVIVGAYKDDDGGTDSGCAFIFLGSASPSSSIDAALADVRLVGESSGDLFFTVSAKRILDARYAELLMFGLKHEG